MSTLLLPLLFLALPGAAPLTAAAPSADEGEVKSGPPLRHEFEVTHSGARGIVTIAGIGSTCGCSKWEATPKVLKPGESAKVVAVVGTLTQPEGAATWKATVKYSVVSDFAAPSTGELELAVSAKIVREIAVEPPLVAISTSGDTARTQTLLVSDRRAAGSLLIAKASCTNAKVTLEIRAAKPGTVGTLQEVIATIPGDLPAGQHDDTITLTTTDPECPELKIPLKVAKRAAGDVSVAPDAATVRFTKGQAEASTLVQFRAGGKPVSISKVTCAQEGVTVKFSEGSGRVATARVTVNLAKAGAFGQTDVTIHLAEPAGGIVVLPVSWYVP